MKQLGLPDKNNEFKKNDNIKLSGWLSVFDDNETYKKSGFADVIWKLKAITFCVNTKRLFISPLLGDEPDTAVESPLKSPGYEVAGTSPKSNNGEYFFSSRSSSITRGRLEHQQSSSFKQFFSKRLAITRTRSFGKIGTQKLDASSPKSPNLLWGSWRSADSDNAIEDEPDTTCINLSDPELSIVRAIHPSLLCRPFCFQVLTPFDMKYFSCCSEEEYNMWMKGLNEVVQSDRDQRIRLNTSLSIWVIEAKNIPIRKRYFCEVSLDKVLFARTSIKCKNDMLFWGEQFSFDDLPPTESVTISLFRESDTKRKRKLDKNVFVGSTVIDLISLETNVEIEKWISVYVPGVSPKMQQKPNASNKTDQTYIRTKLKYDTTVVLPLDSYSTLHEYIRSNYLQLTNALEASISLKTKDILAHTLLKILHTSDGAEQFLVDVIMNEVTNQTNENLTFRGNSLATKSIDTYMKMTSKNYLHETLGSFIISIYESDEDAEVDPQKLSPNSSLSDNQKFLMKIVEEAWKSIFLSVRDFPKKLQKVFSMIRDRCEIQEKDIVKKIVSASLFLRLLCPAILSPSLFGLNQEYPNEKVARTLTLVAKTIQNLANFTRFGSKESYMEILNEFVEREMSNMNNFLQSISYEPVAKEREDVTSSYTSIDLARELSVFYHMLVGEIPKLDSNTKGKLMDLQPILDEITTLHKTSPKAEELRLSRPLAKVASICRKPLHTPSNISRDDTPTTPVSTPVSSISGVLTPSSIVIDNTENEVVIPLCYQDNTLSFSEDYVSGCSLIPVRTGASRPRSTRGTTRTEGRAEQKKTDRIRSTPDYVTHGREFCKRSDSVGEVMSPNGTRVFQTKGKFDKLLSVSSQAANNRNKSLKTEPSLTSYKKRNSIAETPSRRKESSGSIKDRISMFSQRSPSSPSSSFSVSKVNSPTSPTARLKFVTPNPKPTVSVKPGSAVKRQEGYIPVLRKDVDVKVKPSAILNSPLTRKPVVKNKPTVARKPSSEKKTKVTPNKTAIVSQEKSLQIQSNQHSFNTNTPERKQSFNRDSLQLNDLRKEHQFSDSKSPELMTYETSPKRTQYVPISVTKVNSEEEVPSIARSRKITNDRTVRQSESSQNQKLDPIEQKRTFSSKLPVAYKDKFHQHNQLQESTDLTFDHAKKEEQEQSKDEMKMQRRHSEITSREGEKRNINRKTMMVEKSTEIARIHTNGFCEVLHEGIIERSNLDLSSGSSYSSYSSESYYSDDEELIRNGIYIEGDSISDVLMEATDDEETWKYDTSSRYTNGTLGSTTSSYISNSNRVMHNQRENSFTRPYSTLEKDSSMSANEDVEVLRQKLRNTELILHKTRNELTSRTSNFEQTVIHLKGKLVEADRKMKSQRVDTDNQMKSVISRLLNVETELRNEHTEMEAIIKGKQKMIEIQERRIQSLEASNNRLVNALSHIRKRYAPEIEEDESDEQENDNLNEQDNNNNGRLDLGNIAARKPREV